MKKILLTVIIALTMATAGARDYNFNEMTYTSKATTFFLNTNDDAQAVTVRIYDAGKDGNMLKKIDLKRVKGSKDEWTGKVKGDLKGKFYTFDVKYNGQYMGENPGIFAKAVGVNGRRGAIIDLAETNPAEWGQEISKTMSSMRCIIAISRLPATSISTQRLPLSA